MLKIGDFAMLGQVSVRMLCHDDERGLLTPAHIDQWTNYRSYTDDQLARLNRIVAIKDLGFGLEAVGRLLDEHLTLEQLQGMLRLRRAELAQELRSTSERLAAVESRLRLIEREASMTEREFVAKGPPPSGWRSAAPPSPPRTTSVPGSDRCSTPSPTRSWSPVDSWGSPLATP